MCMAMSLSSSWKSSVRATKSLSQFTSMSTPSLPPAWMYGYTEPSLVVRVSFFCAEAMPRLRRTTNASSMLPLVSCNAFRQSPMGAPDFSRSSFTNFASIFSLTVVISLFLVSLILIFPAHQLSPSGCVFQAGRFPAQEKRGTLPSRPRFSHNAHCYAQERLKSALGWFVLVQGRNRGRCLADAAAQCRFQIHFLNRRSLFGHSLGSSFRQGQLFGKGLVAHQVHALGCRVGNLRGEQADGAQRVVVAWNHVVHNRRVAIGVDHRHHRNTQLAGLDRKST